MEFDRIESLPSSDVMDEGEIHQHRRHFSSNSKPQTVNSPHFHLTTTNVHELLECPVCTNSMYPPIHQMVILPPARPPRIIKYLKPYVLKMHFTNKFVSAQVIHLETATVATSASSQEKALRSSMESTRDVAAAAKIGKLLGERLLVKEIPAVSVHLKREQKYHGKVKAVIDSMRGAGIQLL